MGAIEIRQMECEAIRTDYVMCDRKIITNYKSIREAIELAEENNCIVILHIKDIPVHGIYSSVDLKILPPSMCSSCSLQYYIGEFYKELGKMVVKEWLREDIKKS